MHKAGLQRWKTFFSTETFQTGYIEPVYPSHSWDSDSGKPAIITIRKDYIVVHITATKLLKVLLIKTNYNTNPLSLCYDGEMHDLML